MAEQDKGVEELLTARMSRYKRKSDNWLRFSASLGV